MMYAGLVASSPSLPGDFSDLMSQNSLVVRYDDPIFVSVEHVIVDEFAKSLVAGGGRVFCGVGLEWTFAYFTGPESVYSGLAPTNECYNSADDVEGDVCVQSRRRRQDCRQLSPGDGGTANQRNLRHGHDRGDHRWEMVGHC